MYDRNNADTLNNDELAVRITAYIGSVPSKRRREDLSIAPELTINHLILNSSREPFTVCSVLNRAMG
jgi:hypothetical protein